MEHALDLVEVLKSKFVDFVISLAIGEVLLGLDESLDTLSRWFLDKSLFSFTALGEGQLLYIVESGLKGDLLLIWRASITGVCDPVLNYFSNSLYPDL